VIKRVVARGKRVTRYCVGSLWAVVQSVEHRCQTPIVV
jgi:hypothetical protein